METRNKTPSAQDANIVRPTPSVAAKAIGPEPTLDVVLNLDEQRESSLAETAIALIARELDERLDAVEQAWTNPDVVGRHAVVRTGPDANEVIAAAYALVADEHHADAVGRIAYAAQDITPCTDLRVTRNLNAFAMAGTVGVLCAIAVDPEYRHQGHARRLVDARRALLTDLGCDVIYADAWVRPEPCDSVTLYSRLGWHALAEVPSFWERLHTSLGRPCPESSLNCDGVVYVFDDVAARSSGTTGPLGR